MPISLPYSSSTNFFLLRKSDCFYWYSCCIANFATPTSYSIFLLSPINKSSYSFTFFLSYFCFVSNYYLVLFLSIYKFFVNLFSLPVIGWWGRQASKDIIPQINLRGWGGRFISCPFSYFCIFVLCLFLISIFLPSLECNTQA